MLPEETTANDPVSTDARAKERRRRGRRVLREEDRAEPAFVSGVYFRK